VLDAPVRRGPAVKAQMGPPEDPYVDGENARTVLAGDRAAWQASDGPSANGFDLVVHRCKEGRTLWMAGLIAGCHPQRIGGLG
jgi:hypothetical protein